MRLRVLTFNVQHDAGDPRRTGLVNRVLRRLDPDLAAFQEVCYPDDRWDQLAELTAGSGLHTTHQAGLLDYLPPDADRYGGTAVATRWPHRVVEVLGERPAGGSEDHEWTLAVSVQLPGLGEQLLVVPTTPWRLDAEAARERQAVQVGELDARHRAALPTIVAGDLNAGPDASSIRYLSGLQTLEGRSVHYHDAWAVAGDGPGHTWSVDNPVAAAEIDRLVGQPGHRRRIDYVFVGSAHAHPRAGPGSWPPGWSATARSTGSGSATTPASWSTWRSRPPRPAEPAAEHSGTIRAAPTPRPGGRTGRRPWPPRPRRPPPPEPRTAPWPTWPRRWRRAWSRSPSRPAGRRPRGPTRRPTWP